eukprot:scaffold19523_cov114-Isochrysis_galbana.AAC.2
MQDLLVVQSHVSGTQRGEPDGAGAQKVLGDGRDAQTHLVAARLKKAAVEGRMSLLGVRARQEDGGAHVEIDVLGRGKVREVSRGGQRPAASLRQSRRRRLKVDGCVRRQRVRLAVGLCARVRACCPPKAGVAGGEEMRAVGQPGQRGWAEVACKATNAAYSGGRGVHGVSGCRGCCLAPGSEMRHASSLNTPCSPTSSSTKSPSTAPSPSSSCSAVTTAPRNGISKSHRFSSRTRSAKRSVRSKAPPSSTSASARARSLSTAARSCVTVSGRSAPSMRTTPLRCISSKSVEADRGRPRTAPALAPALPALPALPDLPPLPSFAPRASLPPWAPKPPAEAPPRRCLVATSGSPG